MKGIKVADGEEKVCISIFETDLTKALEWLVGGMVSGKTYSNGFSITEIQEVIKQLTGQEYSRQELIDAAMAADKIKVRYARTDLGFFQKNSKM